MENINLILNEEQDIIFNGIFIDNKIIGDVFIGYNTKSVQHIELDVLEDIIKNYAFCGYN